mgnify:CR=1 FL=1
MSGNSYASSNTFVGECVQKCEGVAMDALIRMLDREAPPEDEGAWLLENADKVGADCD